MDNPARVRGGERGRDLRGVFGGLARRHRPLVEPRAQRLPFQQLRYDERRPIMRADVVDGDDAGSVEGGGGARLLLQPRHPIGIAREQRRQDLDRDVAVQPRIARLVDLAHAAGAQQRQDFVGAQAGTGADP